MKKVVSKMYSNIKSIPKNVYWMKCLFQTIHSNYRKEEYKAEIDYLKSNWKSQKENELVFPYSFYEEYIPDINDAIYDSDKEMYYVMQNGKKLYYPGTNKRWIAKKVCNHRREQDARSPHNYFSDGFGKPKENEIFIDVGCAEGGEALDCVDSAKRVILIEQSDSWIPALEASFEKYKDKVTIIKKFASDKRCENKIMLDDIMVKGENYFLKMDVEGAEMEVLRGAKESLSRGGVRCTITTYHRETDAKEIYDFLSSLGYTCKFTTGYLCMFSRAFKEWNARPPYFRKGVIKAYKERV